ncbi:hypothetical protein ABLB84_11830 [Xenorhabdus szentirmaii]|uniref:lipase family alpha/beta hydrolase n=1 Tax=Xenorhabdus szentirmaii TaxID=290112 RepID=UPI0032B7D84A
MNEKDEKKIYHLPKYDEDGEQYHEATVHLKGSHYRDVFLIGAEKVIPIVFIPGVMGTNLQDNDGNIVWNAESAIQSWAFYNAEERKNLLDPETTKVYSGGKFDDLPSDIEKSLFPSRRERGWGESFVMSYDDFLNWLQKVFDDQAEFIQNRLGQREKKTVRQMQIGLNLNAEKGEEALTEQEVEHSYNFLYPVHVFGYNWLQSNAISAKKLDGCIKEIFDYYGDRLAIKKVILVTHSMGGLVARHYSELLKGKENILGIVHGVMPDKGAPAAYRRMKTGERGILGKIIGSNAEEMMPVLANAPGTLQLLPSKAYGGDWLQIKDKRFSYDKPVEDPYEEIYLIKDKWWNLCETRFLGDDSDKEWKRYASLMNDSVLKFIEGLENNYHPYTYAFYGSSPKLHSDEILIWEEIMRDSDIQNRDYDVLALESNFYDPFNLQIKTRRTVRFSAGRETKDKIIKEFKLRGSNSPGDGTVPVRSGKISSHKVHNLLATEVDHEGAYKDILARQFTLRAVVKLVQQVEAEQ